MTSLPPPNRRRGALTMNRVRTGAMLSAALLSITIGSCTSLPVYLHDGYITGLPDMAHYRLAEIEIEAPAHTAQQIETSIAIARSIYALTLRTYASVAHDDGSPNAPTIALSVTIREVLIEYDYEPIYSTSVVTTVRDADTILAEGITIIEGRYPITSSGMLRRVVDISLREVLGR